MTSVDVLRRLPEVPASVQTVLEELEGCGPLTMKQLRERSGLARRTVYGAVRRLKDLGMVDERVSLHDSRQTYVWLSSCRL